jgi:hypothetical protein
MVTLLVGTSRAQPADYFSNFEKICVASRADPKTVLMAADSIGWMPVPASFLEGMASVVSDPQGRMLPDSKSVQAVVVGASQNGINIGDVGLKLTTCNFMIMDSGPESLPPWIQDLENKLAAFTAVPLQQDTRQHNVYIWQTKGGNHVSLTWGSPELRAAVNDGSLELMTNSSIGDGQYMVTYGRVAPKTSDNPNTDPH